MTHQLGMEKFENELALRLTEFLDFAEQNKSPTAWMSVLDVLSSAMAFYAVKHGASKVEYLTALALDYDTCAADRPKTEGNN